MFRAEIQLARVGARRALGDKRPRGAAMRVFARDYFAAQVIYPPRILT